jgi:hypothetical protein
MTELTQAEQAIRNLIVEGIKRANAQPEFELEFEERDFDTTASMSDEPSNLFDVPDAWFDYHGYFNVKNHSAFDVFSNYSYDYLNHVDIVSDAIKWVQSYARQTYKFDHEISPNLLTVWLKMCNNEFIIALIGNACSDEKRYMEEFDNDTYEGDMNEDLGNFLEINNYFNTPAEMRYIFDKAV